MSNTIDTVQTLLARLEEELPRLMLLFPDADGADFWMAFSRRSTRIEAMATPAQVAQVRAQLDRMLASRGLLDPQEPSIPAFDAAATVALAT